MPGITPSRHSASGSEAFIGAPCPGKGAIDEIRRQPKTQCKPVSTGMHCVFCFSLPTRTSAGGTRTNRQRPRIGKAPGSMPKQACAVRCLRRFFGTESCLPCVRRAPAAALFRTFAKQLPQRPRCGSDFPKKPPPRTYSEKPGKYTRLKSGSAKTPLYRAPAVFQSCRERHRALLPGLTPAKRSSSPPPPRRAAVRYKSLSGLTRQPQRSSARPQSASQSPPEGEITLKPPSGPIPPQLLRHLPENTPIIYNSFLIFL